TGRAPFNRPHRVRPGVGADRPRRGPCGPCGGDRGGAACRARGGETGPGAACRPRRGETGPGAACRPRRGETGPGAACRPRRGETGPGAACRPRRGGRPCHQTVTSAVYHVFLAARGFPGLAGHCKPQGVQDMFKRILTRCAAGLAMMDAASVAAHATDLTAAGASFPYTIYAKWAAKYQEVTGNRVNYQSIGSGGGQQQIIAGTVDFGASDDLMKPEDLDK